MGQVGDHLHILAELLNLQLIEQQCENDKGREQQHVFHEAQDQGIFQDLHEGRGLKQHLKILQTRKNPGASCLVIVESKTHIEHGPHAEDDEVHQRGQKKKIQDLIPPHLVRRFGQPAAGGRLRDSFCFAHFNISSHVKETGYVLNNYTLSPVSMHGGIVHSFFTFFLFKLNDCLSFSLFSQYRTPAQLLFDFLPAP